jgi:hypothetical protein
MGHKHQHQESRYQLALSPMRVRSQSSVALVALLGLEYERNPGGCNYQL